MLSTTLSAITAWDLSLLTGRMLSCWEVLTKLFAACCSRFFTSSWLSSCACIPQKQHANRCQPHRSLDGGFCDFWGDWNKYKRETRQLVCNMCVHQLLTTSLAHVYHTQLCWSSSSFFWRSLVCLYESMIVLLHQPSKALASVNLPCCAASDISASTYRYWASRAYSSRLRFRQESWEKPTALEADRSDPSVLPSSVINRGREGSIPWHTTRRCCRYRSADLDLDEASP